MHLDTASLAVLDIPDPVDPVRSVGRMVEAGGRHVPSLSGQLVESRLPNVPGAMKGERVYGEEPAGG